MTAIDRTSSHAKQASSEAEGQAHSHMSRPLRILEMCTMFGVGGIPRHALDLSQWLRERGHHVTMAGAPGDWLHPGNEPNFLTLDLHRITNDRNDATLPGRFAALARSALKLRAWLRRNPVDLIHTHESAPALAAGVATLGMNVPILVTYHGTALSRVPQFGMIARRFADFTLTTNHHSADDVARLGGVPREQLRVIGLGINAPPVSPECTAAIRRQLLGEDGRFLVVTIARLTEQKAIDVLVDVVRRVIAERPDIRFAIVGDGHLAEVATGWAREAGVEKHLLFLGRSDEPQLYLSAGDLFILTSRWEALPYVIAEGFMAGLPAVSTDCGGVTELIDDTVGRVLPIDDAQGLADAVLTISGDDVLRGRLSDAARRRGEEDRFKHDFNNRRMEDLYREAISRRA